MSLRKGKRFLRLAALLLALAALAVPAWATDYYVTTNGMDGATGSSWAAPKTLTAAVTAAGDKDNIYVAKGIYTLTATLELSKNVSLYGGFKGDETTIDPSKRDLKTNATTITGDETGGYSLISVTAGSPTIDGFVITGGKNTVGNGGGMNITTTGTVTVQNCVIKSNTAAGSGGGLSVENGKLNATNCVFDANGAEIYGGGIYAGGNTTVEQCTFTNNTTPSSVGNANNGLGGGVYVAGTLNAKNCTFTLNQAATAATEEGNIVGGGLCIYLLRRISTTAPS